MDASPYLAQALQSLRQPMPQAPPQVDLSAAQRIAATMAQGRDWQKTNPGQNYLMHNLQASGQNVLGAPQRVLDSVRGLPGLLGLGAGAR